VLNEMASQGTRPGVHPLWRRAASVSNGIIASYGYSLARDKNVDPRRDTGTAKSKSLACCGAFA